MSEQHEAELSALFQSLAGEGGPVNMNHAREAILIEKNDLPEITLPDGSAIQLLQVDLSNNLWVVRSRFKPGFCIDTHYHTGTVYAFTESGEWYYKEYPQLVNKAGSYLFEPAQSVHSLTVAPDASEDAVVSFVVNGCNVNVDENGNVTSIIDAQTILTLYQALCKAEGKNPEGVIIQE